MNELIIKQKMQPNQENQSPNKSTSKSDKTEMWKANLNLSTALREMKHYHFIHNSSFYVGSLKEHWETPNVHEPLIFANFATRKISAL